ncbi:YetF domain-containing protein [Thalassobacillus hwangdonensis]|uniref:YetF domain-containing protein n=1 Tax=Thalassobacillus hwangdonensis TaxID=546108 RepID=A0ABW3L5Y3_9BACI
MGVTELLARLALTFIVLLVLTRLMGRKEISQMTFFNFVSAVAIGSLAADSVMSDTVSLRNGMIVLLAWAVFTLGAGWFEMKSKTASSWMNGQPIMVVKHGKVMERSLRKTRLTMDELLSLLRKKGAFSVAEVDYAVFETDGQLSLMKKDLHQQVTKKDLSIQISASSPIPIPTTVISDGSLVRKNMKELNLDEEWLLQQLRSAGIAKVADVFYAEVLKDGALHIDRRDEGGK